MPHCSKCGRKVRQTMHTVDGYKVDYYVDATVGKEPMVLCVECYQEKHHGVARPEDSERDAQS